MTIPLETIDKQNIQSIAAPLFMIGPFMTTYQTIEETKQPEQQPQQHQKQQQSQTSQRRIIIIEEQQEQNLQPEISNHVNKQISALDAGIHLVKGNLGPGCLNLPHAFAIIGWKLGLTLFLLIVLQGIYSMCLLLQCLAWIEQQQQRQQQQSSSSSLSNVLSTAQRNTPQRLLKTKTFMDVSQYALGCSGGRLVQIFLFVLQGGVCCVFLSLLSTNLQAAFTTLSMTISVVSMTCICMILVLIRFLKDLMGLCAVANTFMILAIVTSAIAGYYQFINSINETDHNNQQSTINVAPSTVIMFTTTMFFALEGIGLVLPVENSYNFQSNVSNPTVDSSSADTHSSRRWSFRSVLVCSMLLVATLFATIGIMASLGFPDIRNGSITAYLSQRYPDVVWYSIVNALVMVAVALTFPLQLTPAMEVLDQWLDGCPRQDDPESSLGNHVNQTVSMDPEENEILVASSGRMELSSKNICQTHDILAKNDTNVVIMKTTNVSEGGSGAQVPLLVPNENIQQQWDTIVPPTWILRRWAMVLLCAIIVLFVKDLTLLISLFGAIGQTGLAGMPCAIHLALQRQGIAPPNILAKVTSWMILMFCVIVMIAGCVMVVMELT
jgi:amino acid permease